MKHQKSLSLPFLLASALSLQACGGAGSASDASNDARVQIDGRSLALSGGGSSLLSSTSLLTLSASIAAPAGLYADDIFVNGTNAYVSYNSAGIGTGGAIDLINVLVPILPVRTSTYSSSVLSINGVYNTGSSVYAVGGDGINGAELYTMGSTLGAFTAVTAMNAIPSHVGTAVRMWNSKLYTLTGDGGGLNFFTPGSIADNTTPNLAISDARGMDQSGSSNLWVIAGGGNLYEVNSASTILNTIPFSGANNIAQSKSAVHVGNTAVAASLGTQGAEIVCMADHQLMGNVAPVSISGVSPTLTVANSVTFGNGLMFVANGQAGVAVYLMTNPLLNTLTGQVVGASTACGRIATTYQGTIDFGQAFSVNNVFYNNGVLYVATGSGGFKVVLVDTTLLTSIVGLVTGL